MSNTTDSLIASLAEGMETVKPARHPARLFAVWVTGSLLYACLLLCFSHTRPDLMEQLHRPAFAAEIGLLLLMIISCGLSAVMLSFPDMYQKRALVLAPLVPLLAFTLLMSVEYMAEGQVAKSPHGFECLACITMYSSVPAFALMWMLRKQASTHYNAAGCVALVAASSVGCLALRLAEDNNSIVHMVTWHYLPIAGFALLGVWLGRKLLKW